MVRIGKKAWSRATPTIVDGISFPSKLEARVYGRLVIEANADDARLFRQVRFPLLNLAPDEYGKPLNFTVDFLMIYQDNRVRALDAKGRTAPSWLRGKKAFEAWYGIPVEEIKK